MKEEGTIITKYGRVRINENGYYQITSSKEGNHGKYLHRLVWEDWYGRPVPEGYEIHHINLDKQDNRIQNLQCVEKSLHRRFHNKDEKHHMYGKHHSEETKRKMSEHLKGENHPMWNKHHTDETRRKISENHADVSGENNPSAKYSLWNLSSVQYYKNKMFNGGREPNPIKCFAYKYKGYRVPIGYFHDFITCEIINELVEDSIGEY